MDIKEQLNAIFNRKLNRQEFIKVFLLSIFVLLGFGTVAALMLKSGKNNLALKKPATTGSKTETLNGNMQQNNQQALDEHKDAGHQNGDTTKPSVNSAANTNDRKSTTGSSTSPSESQPPSQSQSPSPSGPTGTKQTLVTQANSDYDYPAGSAYQNSTSPWWLFNNAVNGGPAGQYSISYYPNNYPLDTTISWNNASHLGYPEMVIGRQGPDHRAGLFVYGPYDTTNGQSSTPPPTLPSWVGQPLSALSHMIFSWDITYNSNNNNNFDTLCETFLGPANSSYGANSNETGFILKDPLWWPGTAHTATIGGVTYYFIPNGWATGSLVIIPASVYRTNVPWTSGTIDMWPVLAYAATQGWTSMNYLLQGWEFGNEVGATSGMTGSVTWNHISFGVS